MGYFREKRDRETERETERERERPTIDFGCYFLLFCGVGLKCPQAHAVSEP